MHMCVYVCRCEFISRTPLYRVTSRERHTRCLGAVIFAVNPRGPD